MGQWELVVFILSFYGTNNWMPLCFITIGVHNTTKIITLPVNVFTTVLTRLASRGLQDKWGYSAV
jgi:hypothetical protein